MLGTWPQWSTTRSHPRLKVLNTIARGVPPWGQGAGVAWMRMMGAESVAYHRDTVIGHFAQSGRRAKRMGG